MSWFRNPEPEPVEEWAPEPPAPTWGGRTACVEFAGDPSRSLGMTCRRCGHATCGAFARCDACVLQVQIDELKERS